MKRKIAKDKNAQVRFQQLDKAFNEGHPLIGEPWVKRLLDFSTQWVISKTGAITYLGATLMENKSRGQYEKKLIAHSLVSTN